ncbi:MAG: polyhydroxyalkanoic acid system family protein, partial [Stellaceae bacterium]
PYVSAIDCSWRGDTLDFRLQTLAQTITGTVEVEERVVRITLALPALLSLFGRRIAAAIAERTPKLIGP